MASRHELSSWLEGPGPRGDGEYPGQRLGRPRTGPGSIARVGRRLLGVLIDWLIALVIGRALVRSGALVPFVPLAVFLVEQALLVGTAAASIGQRALGLGVQTLDGRPPGLARAAVRALLLCLLVPALIWDRDQRGLHDRAAGTLLVRR